MLSIMKSMLNKFEMLRMHKEKESQPKSETESRNQRQVKR